MKNVVFLKILFTVIVTIFLLSINFGKSEAAGFGWNKDNLSFSGCYDIQINVRDGSGNLITADRLEVTYAKAGQIFWSRTANNVSQLTSPCLSSSFFPGRPDMYVTTRVSKAGYNDNYSNNFSLHWTGASGGIYRWTRDIFLTTTGTASNNYQISPLNNWPIPYYSYEPQFVVRGEPLGISGFSNINLAFLEVDKCCWSVEKADWIQGVWDAAARTFTVPSVNLPDDGLYQWGAYLMSVVNPANPILHNSSDVTSAWSDYTTFGIDRRAPSVDCSMDVNDDTTIDVFLDVYDDVSGVEAGQVRYSTDGGLNWRTSGVPFGGNTMYNFTFWESKYGETYTFQFRARDRAMAPGGVKNQWSAWHDCGTVEVTPETGYSVMAYVMQLDGGGNCTTSGVGIPGATVNLFHYLTGNPSLHGTSHSSGGVIPQGQSSPAPFNNLISGKYEIAVTGLPTGLAIDSVIIPDDANKIDFGVKNPLHFMVDSTWTDTTVIFCVGSSAGPWYQTDFGDVRFPSLKNPIPNGKFGSTGDLGSGDFPGVYFSSKPFSDLGTKGISSASSIGWLVNDEYAYNGKSREKEGTLSYSFLLSKTKKEGVSRNDTAISPNSILTQTEINSGSENQVFFVDGELTIDNEIEIPGSSSFANRRVVLLVNGDVNINNNIKVDTGSLFILASSGNIFIDKEVGENPSSTATNLEGYYSAEGRIRILGNSDPCTDDDKRLNVAGSLISNARKPFRVTGNGIDLDRSLCASNSTYPTLFVTSRLDFLTQLTDFYKTTYSKWTELKP